MQSIFERVVSGDAATIGTIGVQTKNVFVCPPLTCYPFEASSDQEVRVLNASSTQITDCIALTHDERILAYATSTAIKLIDLQTGREMRTLVGHNGRINAVTQSNRSIYVWASAATDCTVTLWDTRQHPANVQVRRFDRPVNCTRYSPNDAFIALGSDHLYMMDPRVREYRSLPSSSQVLHVCFHPSEYLLATGSEDRLVRFWDIDTEECVSQSDPADGTLREIAFQNDGTALLTLTDCKCSAISWEPFEMLGQCMVPQTDYSLGLATSESEVYVLGRSVSLSNISLLMAPYAKFLAQEEEFLEKTGENDELKTLEKPEEDLSETSPGELSGNDVEEELLSEKEDEEEVEEQQQQEQSPPLVHYYDEHRAFMPMHTLPRTPPPRPVRVVPHSDNCAVTMATTTMTTPPVTATATTTASTQSSSTTTTLSSMPARPKTLRTRQSHTNTKTTQTKVATSARRTGGSSGIGGGGGDTIPRSSLSGLPSRKNTHMSSNSTTMKITNSAPDIRCAASRTQDEKGRARRDSDERKRQRQREPLRKDKDRVRDHDRNRDREQDQEVPSEPCSLDDVLAGLDKLDMIFNQRRMVLENVLHCWRTRGSDVAVTEAARSGDVAVLVELIDAFNHTPAAWNLTLCTAILPHIEPLVSHRNEEYVEVALSALRTIITGCGDVIRTGSHRRSQIGVDVPAEERHSKCIRCMQQLTNMRVKATLLADHMSKPQSREFNALMQIFDDTISPT